MFTLDLAGPGFERRSVEFSAKTATVGSIMERDSLYLPNCQTNLVIALHALSQLFWQFINTTAYHLGRYSLHLFLLIRGSIKLAFIWFVL